MTSFSGSNTDRQSIGLPGHCKRCATLGHVTAHPDLGCSEVGCSSAHPEPVEAIAPVPVAPPLVVVYPADGRGQHMSGSDWRNWDTALPAWVFHLLRRTDRERGNVQAWPTGWMYTATGAHDLDDLLRRMWCCPEATAMLDVPHDSRESRNPHLAVLEDAQAAMNLVWSDFLAEVVR